MIGDIWIDSIEVQIPSGHNGLTGLYVADSGTPILPYSQTPVFLIATDRTLEYDVGNEFGATLTIVTYNQDVFPHTHYVRISGRYMVNQASSTSDAPVDILPIS